MRLFIKDQLAEIEKSVIISLKYSRKGVYICAQEEEDGCLWYLAELTKDGFRLIGSINKDLEFSLDDCGRLKVSWNKL